MKTKQKKPTKQTKSTRKKPATQKTPNGVKVGDRVYCVYRNQRFSVKGTAVALFTYEDTNRIVVDHDEEVQSCQAWGEWFLPGDTTKFKVWGDEFVFPIRK